MNLKIVKGVRYDMDVPPVRLGKIPMWMRQRLLIYRDKKWGRKWKSGMDYEEVFRKLTAHPWMDHWGESIGSLFIEFVSEPYVSTVEDPLFLQFVDALHMQFLVEPESYYNPGKCCRITFQPLPFPPKVDPSFMKAWRGTVDLTYSWECKKCEKITGSQA